MVSSSGLSCRSSPRISAPICWVSGTTSSRVFVIATIVGIESREDGGRASERRRPTPVGTPAERFLAGLKKEVEVRRRGAVRAGCFFDLDAGQHRDLSHVGDSPVR